MKERIGIIAAPGFRSRAYAQRLVQDKIIPDIALLLPGAEPEWTGDDDVAFNIAEKEITFRPNISAEKTLTDAGVKCFSGPSNLNSDEGEKIIRALPVDILIYAGAGGAILSPQILATDKKFLHIHGGWIPRYRGSTAFYFSLLEQNSISVSALWLDEGIDTGPLIARKTVSSTIAVEIDRIFDPCLRADLLANVLQDYVTNDAFGAESLSEDETNNTYFVIHPVLKHIALKRCGMIIEE
jgi:methionyl-tRNA formyltransferase